MPSFSLRLPASEWQLIANVATPPEQATGMDEFWAYSPDMGYYQTDVLKPGQGAWAISYQDSNITFQQVQ